jgi:hypothetical protein
MKPANRTHQVVPRAVQRFVGSGPVVTTETLIAEKPEEKKAMPAMPGGGGYGGMDY